MENTKWTLFWDMHSGGRTKEGEYEYIYIEAPEEEAKIVFYNRFGHDPERISCDCCGEDYQIEESDTLEEASEYHRKNVSDEHITISIEKYIQEKEVLVIYAKDILPDEKK